MANLQYKGCMAAFFCTVDWLTVMIPFYSICNGYKQQQQRAEEIITWPIAPLPLLLLLPMPTLDSPRLDSTRSRSDWTGALWFIAVQHEMRPWRDGACISVFVRQLKVLLPQLGYHSWGPSTIFGCCPKFNAYETHAPRPTLNCRMQQDLIMLVLNF